MTAGRRRWRPATSTRSSHTPPRSSAGSPSAAPTSMRGWAPRPPSWGSRPGCSTDSSATLSGGQAARAGLAALRVARCDVVLLDEPTNHLDADGLRRLAALLDGRAGGVVLVSHDRALLAASVSEIVELDRHSGTATRYRAAGTRTSASARSPGGGCGRSASRPSNVGRSSPRPSEETRRRARRRAASGPMRVHDNDKHMREWVTMRADGMAGTRPQDGYAGRRVEVPDAPWENRPLRLGADGGRAPPGVGRRAGGGRPAPRRLVARPARRRGRPRRARARQRRQRHAASRRCWARSPARSIPPRAGVASSPARSSPSSGRRARRWPARGAGRPGPSADRARRGDRPHRARGLRPARRGRGTERPRRRCRRASGRARS